MSLRELSDEDAKRLPAGSDHYMAYVGPPTDYDLVGALQFRLLCALGLREHHKLLDFGCGSLRAGRLFIPYLAAGRYHGLEPQGWLVKEGIERQIGGDMVRIKQPCFHAFDDFRADRCGTEFDYIMAQSIFSHAGANIISTTLDGFRLALSASGLAVFTILPASSPPSREHAPSAWVYPGTIRYSAETVDALIAGAGLFGRRLPTYHPRQVWYVAARDAARLPARALDVLLLNGIIDAPS